MTKLDKATELLNKGADYYQAGQFDKAVKYYQEAAELGNVIAMSNLGYCYYYGRSIPKDYKMAEKYFPMAAEHDDANALYKLGDMHANGIIDKDMSVAMDYYQRAYKIALKDKNAFNYPDICMRLAKLAKDKEPQKAKDFLDEAISGFTARIFCYNDHFTDKLLLSAFELRNELDGKPSYLSIIAKAKDKTGYLPRGFRLPDPFVLDGKAFPDGMTDGAFLFHIEKDTVDDKTLTSILRNIAKYKYREATTALLELFKDYFALGIIDDARDKILENPKEYDSNAFYLYAVKGILGGTDKEIVKFCLGLLSLFDEPAIGILHNAIETLALNDEFTLFCIVGNIEKWQGGNKKVFELAKHLTGWGRIHAISHLEPETAEIQEWLLADGIHNDISPAYSALDCYKKCGLDKRLPNPMSEKEFKGAGAIVGGLLDDETAPGISEIEKPTNMLFDYLNKANTMAICVEDFYHVLQIRNYTKSPKLRDECKALLKSEKCSAAVKASPGDDLAVQLAKEIGK